MKHDSSECLPKIFIIGHNKTGTRSIHRFFKANGYKSIHWSKGNIARTIRNNFTSTRPLLAGLESYHCYCDMELNGVFYAYTLFPQLDLQYPGSLFIYNKRDPVKWVNSRMKHGRYLRVFKEKYNSKNTAKLATDQDVVNNWLYFFNRHEKMINDYFNGKDNLVTFELGCQSSEKQLIERIGRLGYVLNDMKSLPHIGKTE